MFEDDDKVHEHCARCYYRFCADDYIKHCPVEECPNNCGAVLHVCKLEDHQIICNEVVLPCINSLYGCPFSLARKNMASHLSVCPASTVVCTMEWSRNVAEENEVKPIVNFDPCKLSESDMDTVLAINDQCVAMEWIKNLKMMEQDNDSQNEDLENTNKAALNYKDYQLMLYLQTEKAAHFAANDYSGYPYFDGNTNINTVLAANDTSYVTTSSVETEIAESSESAPTETLQGSELDCYRILKRNTHRDKAKGKKQGHAILEDMVMQPCGVVLARPHTENCSVLALKDVIEFLPRYDTKHGGMYTFMCNCLLRRDEYCTHYQNYHCDFHSSLNGWLEERCPYSSYGCSFTRMRFSPKCGGKVVYDCQRKCIAVQMKQTITDPTRETEINLLNLPWEVLLKVVSYLDSYSIGQLSSTCFYLQSVCMSVLKERGIVEMQWEHSPGENGFQWKTTGFRWLFSSKCSTISQLDISKDPIMSNHLLCCPFSKSTADIKKYLKKRCFLLGSHEVKSVQELKPVTSNPPTVYSNNRNYIPHYHGL